MKKKIIKSLRFRYNHFVKKRKVRLVEKQLAQHEKKVKTITVKNFTIMSSNCWGGSVYEDLELPYQTPTVGLFFYAPCFMELLKDLKTTISLPLAFVEASKYDDANVFRNESYKYPIGKLGTDVEIHFLHYKTEAEAKDKWERRVQRINWHNLFIACTDRDGMTPELMQAFDDLPYKNKVLFTAQNHPQINASVQIKPYRKNAEIGNVYKERYFITSDFNISKWFNQ